MGSTGSVHAPGRVNLMGDHTDYNEGLVLPLAIDRGCTVSWSTAADGRVRARSDAFAGAVDVAAAGTDEPSSLEPQWGRFVAGAVAALAARGIVTPGVSAEVASSVPPGSGLSSSSALSVALVLALVAAAGADPLPPVDAARVALDAEVRATCVPGGLMDQLVSLLGRPGRALRIDCRSFAVEPVPLPDDLAVLVVHCGRARTLAGSEYTERRAACETAAARLGLAALRDATPEQVAGDPIARHVVSENARVDATVAALRAGDRAALRDLLLASHASLRDDFRVSTPELDALVDALVEAGAHGARLTGAGFGGCVVGLADRAHVERVARDATAAYARATGAEAQPFVVRAVAGASVSLD